MAYRATAHTEAKKADTRRRILDAARTIVARGGFAAAQMSAVADAAGVATGTLYRYFADKADLVTEVFRDVSQGEMDRLSAIADERGPAAERLDRAVTTFAGRAIRAGRLAHALLGEPVDPALERERQVFRRTHAGILQRIIEDGIAEGIFPAQDAAMTATCIAGAIPTAVLVPLGRAGKPVVFEPETMTAISNPERTIGELAQFCLRAAGSTEELRKERTP